MKTLNNVLTVTGFLMIGALPFGVMAGSLLLLTIGCAGFALFMKGLLSEV